MTDIGPFLISVDVILLILLTLLVKPLGTYMTNVFQGKRTFLSPAIVPLENLIYKAAGIKQMRHGLERLCKGLLLFNGLGLIVLFLILLLQGSFPSIPRIYGFSLPLAFNTP